MFTAFPNLVVDIPVVVALASEILPAKLEGLDLFDFEFLAARESVSIGLA
jgi:hypothetical protein